MERRRRSTTTSNFGVSKRESHDASGFYGRFASPQLSDDDTVLPPAPVVESCIHGDSRHMDAVADGSVALVVTSPPYFAGKQYEEELAAEGVPGSYLEYLDLLRDVFAECARKLEPGGRIAVNVANLGRKPYRSLSADVIRILQDDLGLLLRGEILWRKGDGASGNCAWGSFRQAANPSLRDVTERVVVASKGRFDRAVKPPVRRAQGLPYESTLMAEDFMSLTLDVWELSPESAKRVGHPAPFPVELPEQLIRLYTYVDDLVLDPFLGSGSTVVAARRLGRRAVGYDLDPAYVAVARGRVADVDRELAERDDSSLRARAEHSGRKVSDLAAEALSEAGFTVTSGDKGFRVPGTGVVVHCRAEDPQGRPWYFELGGPFTSVRGGLQRMETVWRALGRAHAVRGHLPGDGPLVLLTTHLPRRPSEGDTALRAAGTGAFFDVIDVLDESSRDRLSHCAKHSGAIAPMCGFWTPKDLPRHP
jgi:DNA modification methylase